MTLIELIIYLFACCGITFTIVHAEILSILVIRQFLHKSEFFKKLTSCSFCTGFYVGIGLLIFMPLSYMSWILPFAASAFTFLWDRIVILLDEKIIELENKRQGK